MAHRNPNKKFDCPHCEKPFLTKRQLKAHTKDCKRRKSEGITKQS